MTLEELAPLTESKTLENESNPPGPQTLALGLSHSALPATRKEWDTGEHHEVLGVKTGTEKGGGEAPGKGLGNP